MEQSVFFWRTMRGNSGILIFFVPKFRAVPAI